MTLFSLLLFLAAMLPPSFQDNYEKQDFADLSTTTESVRDEILFKHLELRVLLDPPGSDLLKMDLSTTEKSVQEEIVNKHNELRGSVNPPGSDLLEMKWNSDAQVNAQTWADQCAYQHSSQESRKIKNLRCGENIFMASYPATWSQAIQSWYDESKDFKFGSGPTTPGAAIGHYTQLVWNSSHQLGCGVTECPNNPLKYLYVCHYCPPGNFLDRIYTPYTVGEICGSCPNHCDNGLCTNRCDYEDKYSNCPSLKASLTCYHPLTIENCHATCNCEDQIQ
ncbi:cysteine-rich secretory protein 1-like isoform X3 [Alexandromys fortis]|uniref:cysteine-rich secretory protein 1-like isoform X1 n=1 Tax=Alexandromys fortis TaxID=100897 RepID=UPI002153235A|nr:cysteine-rich secretory protein 1-like isoform X1 [Microtus fortis]XP_049980068.1 cysteine-rich secretory protein 1-like isoform X2 [Microtus fortis]XP_049980069.1 cysteine-rich secretory protein 1-like isoform X3 [Microtus fortis]